MKHILFMILLFVCAGVLDAQTIKLDNETRITLSGDSLILQKGASGNPMIGFHEDRAGGKFYYMGFRYDTRHDVWYLLRSYVRPFVREALGYEVCIKTGAKGKEYYLGKMERDTIALWLNYER